MKNGGVLLAAFLFSSASHSSNPFDLYIAQIKSGKTAHSLKEFALSCGVPANQSHPRYALSVGSWEASKNLPREVYAAESDFLSTAELRVGSNGAKVLNLWTIDLEQDINTRFCFAPDGHLRFLDAANYTFNSESSEIVSWVYKQRRTFDSDGRVKSKSGHFEDGQGQKVSPPPMDADEEKSFDWVPSGRTLQELGLPAAWER